MSGTAYFVLNSVLSGAEKRFIRIFLSRHRKGYNVVLVLSRPAFSVAVLDKEFAEGLTNLYHEGRVSILPFHGIGSIAEKAVSSRYGYLFSLHILPLVWKKFSENLKSLCVDNVHVPMSMSVAIAFRRLGFFSHLEVCGPDLAQRIVSSNLKSKLKLCSTVISVSASVRSILAKSIEVDQFPASGLLVAPGCFHDTRTAESIDCGSKEKLIVFASRFVERKNPLNFARAAKYFLSQNPDWRIEILGKGPLETEIKAILKDEIEVGIAVVTRYPNLESILARSSLFVSVIERDNFPSQSILEAMALENALLISDQGDSHLFIGKSSVRNGLLCGTDQKSIESGLQVLTDDYSALRVMGRNSRIHLSSGFSVDEYHSWLDLLYQPGVRSEL